MSNGETTMNELTTLIGKLRKQKGELQNQLGNVDSQLEAVETTLNLIVGKPTNLIENHSLVIEIQGKTMVEALKIIAGKNNNRIKVTDAKRIMMKAGLIHNAQNALSMLYTIINRSGKFTKIKPGEYRLTDVQQSLIS
ncbi:MAG TPA: hypothetical protein DCX22_04640 [Dehalococcoidia bacterium]|nr:hypothetical protein [Dehalococcoidia bacterium]